MLRRRRKKRRNKRNMLAGIKGRIVTIREKEKGKRNTRKV